MSISFACEFACQVYINGGTQTREKIVDVQKVAAAVGQNTRFALPGLHSFTVDTVETVSAFGGKGKITTFKLMQKNTKYQDAFTQLGKEWPVPGDLFNMLQEFTCKLYAARCPNATISYLSQHIQVIKIQNTLSHPLSLMVGVPQGSILGLILFTLYVNDLLHVPKHSKALGYVDDTKLFLGFPSNQLQEIISAVNDDLKEISSWCCRNSLLINPDKTKLVCGSPTTHEDSTCHSTIRDIIRNRNQASNCCKGFRSVY